MSLYLSHAVIVVQKADVLLLDHLDEVGQRPRQLAAPVNEAVHAVLYIKPVLKITDPASTWNEINQICFHTFFCPISDSPPRDINGGYLNNPYYS